MTGEPVSRLDGWKAIADYLGRDVRTVQRWREERGMPVHRIPGGKRGTVFAERTEIDAWLLQRTGVRVRATPQEPVDDLPPVPSADAAIDESLVGPQRSRFPARRIVPIAAALVAAAGVAMAVIRTRPSAVPAHFALDAGTLTARAADDSVLWTFRLPEQPGTPLDGALVDKTSLVGIARAEFRGENPDVLALVSLNKLSDAPDKPGFLRDDVYCLSAGGAFRWRFHPADRWTFAGRLFAGPWRMHAWTVLPAPTRRLWAAFIDHVWWPSFVASIDGEGHAQTVFVNSGHITSLAPVHSGPHTYVFAGGVNNEYRSAALAVLDPNDAPAASPQTAGAPFACDGCPAGGPYRYFVFPRLEVAAAQGVRYEQANEINGGLGAGPIEVSISDLTSLRVRAIYRFSDDLMPESVAMSDRYWEVHRELSRNGTLDHAPEDCPERTSGVMVRMWRSGTGWSDVKVLPTFVPRETR